MSKPNGNDREPVSLHDEALQACVHNMRNALSMIVDATTRAQDGLDADSPERVNGAYVKTQAERIAGYSGELQKWLALWFILTGLSSPPANADNA